MEVERGLELSGGLRSALDDGGHMIFVVLAGAAESGNVAVLEEILAEALPRDLFRLYQRWTRAPEPKPSWFVDLFISRLAEELYRESGDLLRLFLRNLVNIGARVDDKREGSAVWKAFGAAACCTEAVDASEVVVLLLKCGCDVRLLYWGWRNRSWLHRSNHPFPLHILLLRLGKETDACKRAALASCIDRVVRIAGGWVGKSDDYARTTSDNPIWMGVDAAFKRRDMELLQVMASWGISDAHRKLHGAAANELAWTFCTS